MLTREEKALARRLNVSAKDVYIAGSNACGTIYGLHNGYYLTEVTINGYSRREVYRQLLRKLISQFN